MVAPMNESDLLSPDYDSFVKKDALISNLNTNNYSRGGINWAKPLRACSSYNIAKILINLDAK